MTLRSLLDSMAQVVGYSSFMDALDDMIPVIRATDELMETPPFRKCKSRKWQRRRNKQFYRILDKLEASGREFRTEA